MVPVTLSTCVVLLVTFFVPLANAAALAPRASGSPSCFECPPKDLAGRPLGEHSNSASELFCRFENVPNDFFCKYFRDTGLLKQDHDEGFCPPVAGITQCVTARENIVAVLKRRANARAARPQTSQPEFMAVRDVLGKKKRA